MEEIQRTSYWVGRHSFHDLFGYVTLSALCGLTNLGIFHIRSFYEVIIRSPVQVSYSVMADSLWLQHARLPCPSPTPGVCSDSRPLSQWCHPTISSFVVPLSSCLQSSPALGSFPMSQFFSPQPCSIFFISLAYQTLITQGILRALGALCQDLGPKIKYFSLYHSDLTYTTVFTAALFTITRQGSKVNVHWQMSG